MNGAGAGPCALAGRGQSDRGRDRDKPEGKTFSSGAYAIFSSPQKLYHAQARAAVTGSACRKYLPQTRGTGCILMEQNWKSSIMHAMPGVQAAE